MDLIVQKRKIFGKKVKSLRQQGLIPAELYGHGFENLHLDVPAKEFSRTFKEAGESAIIKLKVKNEEGKEEEINVLIHDFQKNPLTDEISHIDFYRVRMDEKIKTSIPLEFVGVSPAVEEKNGILVKAMQLIEIEALPGDLPHHLEVDIGLLSDIGTSIRVKNLKAGEGVKILVGLETVVATIIEAAKEEIEEKPIAVEEVKVEGEEKKEEEKKEKENENK